MRPENPRCQMGPVQRILEDCLTSDPAAHAACIRARRDCIDACVFAGRLEARSSPLAEEARRLCRLACEACAKECMRTGCSACAQVCGACATACS